MYKPLKNRVHKYFCFFFSMLPQHHVGRYQNLYQPNQLIFFLISKKKNLLLTRNILDEKKFTKMNVLFKIIHAF